MNRFVDVNPQRRDMGEMGGNMNGGDETPRESRLSRMKNFCAQRCPSSANGWLVTLLTAVLVWQLLVSWSVLPSLTFPMVNRDSWQAVFLTNGQIFFGNLRELNRDYAQLSNVYYLQVSQELLPSSQTPQQQISLVKLGSELYAPADMINVPKSQILHWEDMKGDSPIVQAINQMKENAAKQAAEEKK